MTVEDILSPPLDLRSSRPVQTSHSVGNSQNIRTIKPGSSDWRCFLSLAIWNWCRDALIIYERTPGDFHTRFGWAIEECKGFSQEWNKGAITPDRPNHPIQFLKVKMRYQKRCRVRQREGLRRYKSRIPENKPSDGSDTDEEKGDRFDRIALNWSWGMYIISGGNWTRAV